MPVTWEHCDAVRIAFEGVQKRHQIIWMLSGLVMGGYGLYAVIVENSYGTFFAAWAAWMILNVSIGARDTTALVQHLIDQEREAAAGPGN